MSAGDWIALAMGLGGWLAAIVATISLYFQKHDSNQIKKQHVEELTDQIMFYTNLYENKLNASGYVQRRKPIPLEESEIPQIREAIRDCLMRESKRK